MVRQRPLRGRLCRQRPVQLRLLSILLPLVGRRPFQHRVVGRFAEQDCLGLDRRRRLEYAIDNHWSILGEVRYVSFEHVNVALPLSFYQTRQGIGGNGEFGVFGYNASFNEILAQVGVDYRF